MYRLLAAGRRLLAVICIEFMLSIVSIQGLKYKQKRQMEAANRKNLQLSNGMVRKVGPCLMRVPPHLFDPHFKLSPLVILQEAREKARLEAEEADEVCGVSISMASTSQPPDESNNFNVCQSMDEA